MATRPESGSHGFSTRGVAKSNPASLQPTVAEKIAALQAHRGNKTKEAKTYLAKAAVQHKKFVSGFRNAKAAYLTAGAFLAKAHPLVLRGEWEPLLEQCGLERTAAHRYETLYKEAMDWARAEHATLTDDAKLFKCALEMVIQSPKGLVALCRDLGEMKQFGTYDAAAYEAKKLTQAADTAIGRIDEGTYRRVLKSLDWVVADTLNVEGLGQHSIDQLADWLEKALHKLRSVKETIPVEAVTTALEGGSKPEASEPAKDESAETLYDCPHCGRANFTARSSHRCGKDAAGKWILRKGKDLREMYPTDNERARFETQPEAPSTRPETLPDEPE